MKNVIKDLLELAGKEYEEHIEGIAVSAAEHVVVPFCVQYGLTFKAGNGTFVFTREDGHQFAPHAWLHDVGKRTAALNEWHDILEICNLEVPRMSRRFGSFMPDYPPEEEST